MKIVDLLDRFAEGRFDIDRAIDAWNALAQTAGITDDAETHDLREVRNAFALLRAAIRAGAFEDYRPDAPTQDEDFAMLMEKNRHLMEMLAR